METPRWLSVLLLAFLVVPFLPGCAAPTVPPAPPQGPSPTTAPASSGANPVARLGLASATSIEVLALAQGAGGQRGYSPRTVISDAAAVARVVAALNTDLKALPKALCIPEYELRFRLPGGGAKSVMYSCEGASFLRSDDPAWGVADLQPPAGFDKLMSDLVAAPAPMPPAVAESAPEQAEAAREAALATLSREQPGQAPVAGLPWEARRMTPQGLLGYETWQFTAKNWVVTIGYPVTRLDQVIYHVTVVNQTGGQKWERDLPAAQVPMGVPAPPSR